MSPTISSLRAVKPEKDVSMSKNKDDKSDTITFEEFSELCTQAGISTDNTEQLEQDFRIGQALADVTDALITSTESTPAVGENEALVDMDSTLSMLESLEDAESRRKAAVDLAAQAVRYAAEHTHDEGRN